MPIVVAEIVFATILFNNPNEEHMGSTTFGNATPATIIGLALPLNIKINRAGLGRVRGDGRA